MQMVYWMQNPNDRLSTTTYGSEKNHWLQGSERVTELVRDGKPDIFLFLLLLRTMYMSDPIYALFHLWKYQCFPGKLGKWQRQNNCAYTCWCISKSLAWQQAFHGVSRAKLQCQEALKQIGMVAFSGPESHFPLHRHTHSSHTSTSSISITHTHTHCYALHSDIAEWGPVNSQQH